MNYHLPFPEDFPWRPRSDAHADDSPDLKVALAVIDRLRGVRRLRQQQITVQVQNKVVILEGMVASTDLRDLAAAQTWRTEGVFDVCNRLLVPPR